MCFWTGVWKLWFRSGPCVWAELTGCFGQNTSKVHEPRTHIPSLLAVVLEMLAHIAESSPRKPRNPLEKTLDRGGGGLRELRGGSLEWTRRTQSFIYSPNLLNPAWVSHFQQPVPPFPPTLHFVLFFTLMLLIYSPPPHPHPLIDRHSTFRPLIGLHLNLCSEQPNPTPTWPPLPQSSPPDLSYDEH